MANWKSLIAIILMGFILAFLGTTPPASHGADAPVDQFASGRAMEDIRIIAVEPHPTGSAANATVRTYLADRLTALGLEVSLSESLLEARPLERLKRWSGEAVTQQPIVNVIGVLPGSDRSAKALLLMAHHDTVWDSPGAADDTIGIAAILEILRAVKTMEDRKRDIIVLFTDAEEVGLAGARHFFNDHPLRETVGAVINFEARGGGGTANMFQTSTENGEVARLYAKSVSDPSASSLSVFVYNALPNDTDLTPALKKEYAAFNIANIGRAEYYHSPKITADVLSERTLQHLGSQGLDLTRAIVSADKLPQRAPDATFFDLFGWVTLLYPPMLGWVFLLFAGIFYGLSLREDFALRGMVSGALRMVGFVGLGALGLYMLNALSGNGPSANYYDRLAAIHELEWVAGFALLGLFLIIFGTGKLPASARVGLALPVFLMGLAGQILAPTATYFISLSLFVSAVAALILASRLNRTLSAAFIIISYAVVFGYMLALGHLLMLGVGPDLLSVAVLPAMIMVMTMAFVYPGVSRRRGATGWECQPSYICHHSVMGQA